MKVDISTDTIKLYDVVGKIEVTEGSSFKAYLSNYEGEKVTWASDNDKVLDIDDKDDIATIKASATGKSTIYFMQNGVPIDHRDVFVHDKINEPVSQLGASAKVVSKPK